MNEKIVKDEIMDQTSLPSPDHVEKIGLGTNQIIGRISPDRSHVTQAVRLLVRERFLKQRKNWKLGQSKNIRPTALGFEILKLIQDIASFNKTNQTLFPAILIWRDKFERENLDPLINREKDYPKHVTVKEDDYPKLTGYSKDEMLNLQNYYNMVGHIQSMFNSFLLTIIISRFMDISHRYQLTRNGIEILQKIVMDLINNFFGSIVDRKKYLWDIKEEIHSSDLNSGWRHTLYGRLGYKILTDMYNFYAIQDAPVDEEMRSRIREAFLGVINLLNPPPQIIHINLGILAAGIHPGVVRQPDGSREEAFEDLNAILANCDEYLQRYMKYLEAFS